MTWKMLVYAMVLVLGAAAAAPAFAEDPAMPRVDKRQELQRDRIGQGVSSSQLTPRETILLEREQAGIGRAEAWAKADGVVTPEERVRLQGIQNRANRHIYRQKHDANTRR